ncbi:MAG: DNA topoisomerase VI subunit B, partial [Methanotrichaceae archaeon]|nr:DNA topoisomerase VI subunit B [Methanotrichaceae archaeon]
KEEIIKKLLPRIADKLSEILGEDKPDITLVVAKIMGNLFVKRLYDQKDGFVSVKINLENHGEIIRSFKLHEVLSQEPYSVSLETKSMPIGDNYDCFWKISLKPGEGQQISYDVPSGTKFSETVIEGLESEVVTGARVI